MNVLWCKVRRENGEGGGGGRRLCEVVKLLLRPEADCWSGDFDLSRTTRAACNLIENAVVAAMVEAVVVVVVVVTVVVVVVVIVVVVVVLTVAVQVSVALVVVVVAATAAAVLLVCKLRIDV